jgi:hypothetical protein
MLPGWRQRSSALSRFSTGMITVNLRHPSEHCQARKTSSGRQGYDLLPWSIASPRVIFIDPMPSFPSSSETISWILSCPSSLRGTRLLLPDPKRHTVQYSSSELVDSSSEKARFRNNRPVQAGSFDRISTMTSLASERDFKHIQTLESTASTMWRAISWFRDTLTRQQRLAYTLTR